MSNFDSELNSQKNSEASFVPMQMDTITPTSERIEQRTIIIDSSDVKTISKKTAGRFVLPVIVLMLLVAALIISVINLNRQNRQLEFYSATLLDRYITQEQDEQIRHQKLTELHEILQQSNINLINLNT